MSRMNYRMLGILYAAIAAASQPAAGQLTIPGANGSDGAFSPIANIAIDLAQAATGVWDASSPVSGKGIYDPDKWAVVFKYTSVSIPTNVTVTFLNHPSGAPVLWLVNGNVTINGTISLDGEEGALTKQRALRPGPGGFYGGIGSFGSIAPAADGFGPGGGNSVRIPGSGSTLGAGSYGSLGSGGSTAGSTYGNDQLLPIIGGSGGAGRYYETQDLRFYAGGGGGGAILIAARDTIMVSGKIHADGGRSYCTAGNGSGGAIRLVANRLAGATTATFGVIETAGGIGSIGNNCSGFEGGLGRIRLEAVTVDGNLAIFPNTVNVPPPNPPLIWPPSSAPQARVVSVAGVTAPDDPVGIFDTAQADVVFDSTDPTSIVVETTNVDPTFAVVHINIEPEFGARFSVVASHVSGDYSLSTWSADVSLTKGLYAVQVRVALP